MDRQTSWIWMKLCTEWPFSWVLTICPIRSTWTDRQSFFKHCHIYYAFLLDRQTKGFQTLPHTLCVLIGQTDKGFSNSATYTMRSYWTDRQRVFKHCHIHYASLLDRKTMLFQTLPHTLCVLIEQTDKAFSNIATYTMRSYWTDRQNVFKHCHLHYVFLLDRQTKGFQTSSHTLCVLIGQTDKGFSNIATYTMCS